MVYDLVAMIGAVGGTMGLCIGFSFNDALNFVLGYLEMGVNWIKSRVANNRHVSETARKVKPVDQEPENMVNQCKTMILIEVKLKFCMTIVPTMST